MHPGVGSTCQRAWRHSLRAAAPSRHLRTPAPPCAPACRRRGRAQAVELGQGGQRRGCAAGRGCQAAGLRHGVCAARAAAPPGPPRPVRPRPQATCSPSTARAWASSCCTSWRPTCPSQSCWWTLTRVRGVGWAAAGLWERLGGRGVRCAALWAPLPPAAAAHSCLPRPPVPPACLPAVAHASTLDFTPAAEGSSMFGGMSQVGRAGRQAGCGAGCWRWRRARKAPPCPPCCAGPARQAV